MKGAVAARLGASLCLPIDQFLRVFHAHAEFNQMKLTGAHIRLSWAKIGFSLT
jgi:hypothetical protein